MKLLGLVISALVFPIAALGAVVPTGSNWPDALPAANDTAAFRELPPPPSAVIPQGPPKELSKRVAPGSIWITHWVPGPWGFQQRIKINGQGFTINSNVYAVVYKYPSLEVVASATATATAVPGFSGGSFGVQLNAKDCLVAHPGHATDSYAAVYDWTTGLWSNQIWVYTGCPGL